MASIGGNLSVGFLGGSNNVVVITDSGSALVVGGTYTINRGTNYQFGGTVTVGNLVVTDTRGLYVFDGGVLNVTNSTLISNGVAFTVGTGTNQALLNLNGGTHTFSDGVSLGSNGVLKGSGTVAASLSVGSGATLAPGKSPGTLTNAGSLTWAGGGTYQWEINDAIGSVGTNSDLVVVSGALGTLGISATALNPFVIDITGLNPLNAAGAVTNFNSTSSYVWTILTTSQGITGFDVAAFVLNTANFTNFNAIGTGFFSLVQNGNNLDLTFTGVPEPTSGVALLAGVGLALGRRRRKS
jgi:hypothetical protein